MRSTSARTRSGCGWSRATTISFRQVRIETIESTPSTPRPERDEVERRVLRRRSAPGDVLDQDREAGLADAPDADRVVVVERVDERHHDDRCRVERDRERDGVAAGDRVGRRPAAVRGVARYRNRSGDDAPVRERAEREVVARAAELDVAAHVERFGRRVGADGEPALWRDKDLVAARPETGDAVACVPDPALAVRRRLDERPGVAVREREAAAAAAAVHVAALDVQRTIDADRADADVAAHHRDVARELARMADPAQELRRVFLRIADLLELDLRRIVEIAQHHQRSELRAVLDPDAPRVAAGTELQPL